MKRRYKKAKDPRHFMQAAARHRERIDDLAGSPEGTADWFRNEAAGCALEACLTRGMHERTHLTVWYAKKAGRYEKIARDMEGS